MVLTSLRGVPIGTAQNRCIAIRVGKSGTAATRWISRVLPRAVTPETCFVLPARYGAAPTISPRNPGAGPPSPGLRLRSSVYLKVSAVTGAFEGGEKRKPLRILKMYVLPSAERVGSDRATSGSSCEP